MRGAVVGGLYNKANAPYLIAGTLATLVLLASGTLAVAPYVAFLSPIAALGTPLPIILTLFALSIVVIAISLRMISQNKKLDEKEAELNEKNGLAKEQENTIQSLEPQIKELNKRLSSQYNEIVKLIGSAAKKDEVKELSNQLNGLVEEKQNLESKVERLNKRLSGEVAKLRKDLDSAATNNNTEIDLSDNLYIKGETRNGKKLDKELDDLVLTSDLMEVCKEICKSQKKSDDMKGYIFHGPTGTGKTTVAAVIANKVKNKSAFIAVTGSDLLDRAFTNEVFKKAEKNVPCIILIDEIDSIGKDRKYFDSHPVSLDHLLPKLRGVESPKGVTVIGTTNLPRVLDNALRSRFSKILEFPALTGKKLEKMLVSHLKTAFEKVHLMVKEEKLVNTAITRLPGLASKYDFSHASLGNLVKCITDDVSNHDVRKLEDPCYIKNFCSTYNIGLHSNSSLNTTSSFELCNVLSDSGYTSRCSTPDNSHAHSEYNCTLDT